MITDAELIQIVAYAEAGKGEALQIWLDTTPAVEANDALRHVAINALKNKPVLQKLLPKRGEILQALSAVSLAVALVVFTVPLATMRKDITTFVRVILPMVIVMVLSACETCWEYRRVKRYASARSAVLLLARRGDRRALPLLASEWQHLSKPFQHAWNEQVAVALTQLLDKSNAPLPPLTVQEQLRKVGESLLLRSRKKRARNSATDLSLTETYLAVAIMRCVQQSDVPANRALVKRVASGAFSPRGANEQFVQEAARALQQMQIGQGVSRAKPPIVPLRSFIAVAPVKLPIYKSRRILPQRKKRDDRY